MTIQIPTKLLLGKFITLKDVKHPPQMYIRVDAASSTGVILAVMDQNGILRGKIEYQRQFFDEFFTIAGTTD